MGDELTLDFVEALVAAEQPGRRGSPDVLAVSFSASDYIGHAFGPNSLEAEDNLLRLDRTLARLFQLVDRSVGLYKTLIVLSSDHGMAPEPEYLAELGIEAGRLDAARFMEQVNVAVAARFAPGERLAPLFRGSGVYLDLEALARLGLEVAPVEKAVADELGRVPGLAFALTRTDLLAGNIPLTPEARRVAAAFHPRRSGNVLLVQEAFWYLDLEPDGNAAMHGSPYAYDTLVPLMFAGPGIAHRAIYRAVAPRDLAPTISARLGVPPPSGSAGVPLREVTESWP
jgi:arylsulfatase A-like enzyme